MTTVPYTDSSVTNLPSSFDTAQSDDFFGFGNAMQAIASITPKYRNPDGSVQQPTQIVSVNSGNAPPNLSLDASGGTFFDLRSSSEIFANMDAILNEHREKVLNSPQTLKMLGQQ